MFGLRRNVLTKYAIHKLSGFFLPVITTGFDRKKYSWKNFSLEGKGILSHVEPMLTGPEYESWLGPSLFGTRYKLSNILFLAKPADDKLPSNCLKVSHFALINASNSWSVLDPWYCSALGGLFQLGWMRQVRSTIFRGKKARSPWSTISRLLLFTQEIELTSDCFNTPMLARLSFLKASESLWRIEVSSASHVGCNPTKTQPFLTDAVIFVREYSSRTSNSAIFVPANSKICKR